MASGAPASMEEILQQVYDSTNKRLKIGVNALDDAGINFGTDSPAKIQWQTDDANANLLAIIFPEGGATDVPVLVIGDATAEKDLTFFDGVTEPAIAVINDAADAYVRLDAGDDAVAGSKGLYFKAAADEDIELINLSVGGTPRVFWDESEDAWSFSNSMFVSGGSIGLADGGSIRSGGTLGSPNFITDKYATSDANAQLIQHYDALQDANDVPVWMYGDVSIQNVDTGLFDGVTQPTITMIEKDAKYTSATTANALLASPATLTLAATFGSSVVGDIVRLVSGTNVTAGWYWITTVTDAANVILDRNFMTVGNAANDIVFVAYHDFTMLSADGICTRIMDGAPGDGNVEIDRDGWLILDVGQANGRLYWRANNAWHYVNATA